MRFTKTYTWSNGIYEQITKDLSDDVSYDDIIEYAFDEAPTLQQDFVRIEGDELLARWTPGMAWNEFDEIVCEITRNAHHTDVQLD